METQTEPTTQTTDAPPVDLEPATTEVTNKLDGSLKLKKKGTGETAESESGRSGRGPMKDVQLSDDMTLRDYLMGLGVGETVRIDVSRKEPREVIVNGKKHNTAGFLRNYNELIDEARIKEDLGGGLYTLRINAPGPKGSLQYLKSRDVRIEGEPIIAAVEMAAATKPEPSSNKAETRATEVLAELATSALKGGGEMDQATKLLIEQMRLDTKAAAERHERELARRDQELKELRADMARLKEVPVERDTFKDSMLKGLMDGEGARIQAMRANHESEIRQLKEGHQQEIQRINDRHDRALERTEKQHDREVTQLAENHKRELDMLRMSKDSEIMAMKTSADTQKEIFTAEKNRLTKENDRLADELKDLRKIKEKSPIELLKEVKTIKEAIGAEDSEPETIGEKLTEAAPMILQEVGNMISRVKGQPPVQQAQQQQQQRPPQRQIVTDQSGNKFMQHNGRLVPVKKKGQVVQLPTPDGQGAVNVEIPQIDPQKVEFAVNYLERAFAGGQEPEVVAMSIKPNIPEEILTAISNLGGIDQFMARVAKLSGASPLASQGGKNWVRKVGKALVGE